MWICRGSVRRFSYSLRAVSPVFGSRPDISELNEREIMDLKPPEPTPPRVKISLPLRSKLRTFFFPSSHMDVLMRLVSQLKPAEKKKYKRRLELLNTRLFCEGSGVVDDWDDKLLTGFLLHITCKCDDPQYFESVLSMIDRSNVQLDESHYNGILTAMNRYGWAANIKRTFQDMQSKGIKCRLETIFALVTTAVQRKDFEFAVELMTTLTEGMYDQRRACARPFPMDLVVDGCVGAKRRALGLIEQVLEWHRMTEVALSVNTVESLTKWVKR